MLRQFAAYNRAIVTMNIISFMADSKAIKIEFSTDASVMINAMMKLPLFEGVNKKDVMQLITGKAHNTFSCYLNHERQEKVMLVSKGAITYALTGGLFFATFSPGENAGLVAFNITGVNCAVSCTYAQFLESDYELVTSVEDARAAGVGQGPHGGGRPRSATDTATNVWHHDVAAFARYYNLMYNLGTSTPGDGSCIDRERNAYNFVDTQELSKSFERSLTLNTLATFKEGTDFSGVNIAKFRAWILDYATLHARDILEILEKNPSFDMLSPDDENVVKGLLQIDMPLARSLFTQNNMCLEDLALYRLLAVVYNEVIAAYWSPALQVASFKLDEVHEVDDECEEE
jgi:hypothetical protein